MKTVQCGLYASITVCICSLQTILASTNTADIAYTSGIPDFRAMPLRPTWRDIYAVKLNESGYNSMFDRFGPFAEFGWIWDAGRTRSAIVDSYNSAGKSAVSKMLTYATRETAVSVFLPNRNDTPLRSFVAGSVGNTAEQEASISGSFSAAAAAWMRNGSGARTKYGVRIGTSPYGYFKLGLGRDDGQPIILSETRVRYSLLGTGRLEERILVPLPHGWDLDVGVSFLPTHIRSGYDDAFAVSAQLNHMLGRHASQGAISIGAYRNEAATVITFGLFIPW